MPEYMKYALADSGLQARYDARPPYQKNDYIWWIISAVRAETRQKRLDQMLRELKKGGVYMDMKWKG